MNIPRNDCPLCGGKNVRPDMVCEDRLGFKEKFSLYRCKDCTFLFTNPALSPEDVWRYYEGADYGPLSDEVRNPVDRFAHLVRKVTVPARCRMVEKVSGKRTGSLLEIGAGTGVFASTMQRRGWNVVAADPSQGVREQAMRHHGISVHDMDILEKMKGRTFDVVLLWQTLEHVPDIHETMEIIRSFVLKDGIAVIAVPNHTCFDARYYGSRWASYDPPLHYSHFTRRTMATLASLHGFYVAKAFGLRFVSQYVSVLTEYAHGGSVLRGFIVGTIADLLGRCSLSKSSSIAYILKPVA